MLNNQLSSSQINETLLNAMKTIAQKEVQNLEFDVTEKCTIVRKDKDKNKEECYIIRCNGAEWEAYETNGIEYYKNDIVLVNIPKNKWTEKKYIIGLADTQTNTHFFPASNFVPLRTENPTSLTLDENKAIVSLSKRIDTKLIPIFNYSNSLYLKCDFRYNKKPGTLTYDYGLKIIISYGKNITNKELVFSSNLFTGNPDSPYFFTQDILFENIEDENLNSVETIVVEPYCSSDYSVMKNDIEIRNLELKIGHLLNGNSGLKIVTDNLGLKYNEDSEGALSYSTATLGLIWYNTDENGNYIGFNNGIEIISPYNITESVSKDKIDYSQITVDEYEYIERKNRFDQIYSLYETGLCPYDIEGLQMADDVLIAEKQLKTLFSKILSLNTDFKSFVDEYSQAFLQAFNYLIPEDYVKRTDDIGNIEDDYQLSTLREHRTAVGETFNLIIKEFDELMQANVDFKNELEEGYNHWQDFFAKVLTNVRLMQDLEFKVPQDGEDSNTINLVPLRLTEPKYLPIVPQDQNLNFEDIIKDAKENLQNLKNNINTHVPNLINILIEEVGAGSRTSLTNYYNQCFRAYCIKKGYDPYNRDTFKDDEDIIKFETEFTELITPLKLVSNNTEIDPIWGAYNTNTFSINLDSIIKFINSDICKYKNSNKIELQNCSFWKNSNFIYTASYNKTEPYYNLYYSKYADFLDQLKKDNWELTDETNVSLIEEDLLFDPVFDNYIKEEEKKKFALYWYKEDLSNLEKDLLLGEDCWTLIDQCKDTSISSCGFPNFWENPTTQKEVIANNKIYHLQSCTPFDNKSIIEVPLDLNKKTTTFKVVLYYDHVLQGSAEITFSNVQYQSIGTENSLMDIEYKNDVYTLLPYAKSSLDLSIFCYDPEDGRKLNEKVQWGNTSDYPNLVGKWMMTSDEFSRKVGIKSYNSNKGNMTYTLSTYPSGSRHFGVIRLRYSIKEDDFTDSYFPVAWSSQRALSLEGPKILSILNDNGEYEWDIYNGTNKKNPKPYQLLGAENIHNVEYCLKFYDRAGQLVENITETYIDVYGEEQTIFKIPLQLKEIENSSSIQTATGKEYTLKFDYSTIEDFIENYEAVLVITGESAFGTFEYWQSLFIYHYDFDYDKDVFNPVEGTIDSSLLVKEDSLIFFDDREKDLFNYLIRNGTKIGNLATLLASNKDLSMNDYMSIRGALGTIISTKKYAKAFQFYFDEQRDEKNVLPLKNINEDKDYEKSDWKHIYEDINSSTHPDILKKKIKVYLQVPNVNTSKIEKHEQTYRQQLKQLFDDLHAIAIDYQTTNEKWKTRRPVEISYISKLLQDIDWDIILENYGKKNEEEKE